MAAILAGVPSRIFSSTSRSLRQPRADHPARARQQPSHHLGSRPRLPSPLVRGRRELPTWVTRSLSRYPTRHGRRRSPPRRHSTYCEHKRRSPATTAGSPGRSQPLVGVRGGMRTSVTTTSGRYSAAAARARHRTPPPRRDLPRRAGGSSPLARIESQPGSRARKLSPHHGGSADALHGESAVRRRDRGRGRTTPLRSGSPRRHRRR